MAHVGKVLPHLEPISRQARNINLKSKTDFNNNAEIGARSIPRENKFISVGQPPPQKAFSSGSSSGTEEVSSDELTPDDDIYLNPIPGSRIGHI